MGLFKPNISKLEEKRDVKGLIKALGYGDKYVQEFAANALTRLRGPFENAESLIEPLSKYLQDPVAPGRRACLEMLGKIGSDRAVDLLLSHAGSEDSRLVLFTLAELNTPRTLPLLLKALDENSELDLVLPALVKYGDAAVQPLVEKLRKDERLDLFLPALLKFGAAAVEPLCRLLVDPGCPAPVRLQVAKALGEMGDTRAIPALMQESQKENEPFSLRIECAAALGKLGDERVTPLLVSWMKAGRREAADELDKLRWKPQPDEAGATYAVLKGDYSRCAEIGEPAVLPLLKALKTLGLEEGKKAVKALARIGVPAVPYLLAALQDQQYKLRFQAADALDRMQWNPHRDPASAPWYWIAKEAWAKVAKLGNDALPALLGTLEVDSLPVRIQAAVALGNLGDLSGIDVIISTMGNENIRNQARQALDQLGWKPGLDESSACYHVAMGNLDACLEIGAASIRPIVAALQGAKRKQAARTLLQLYRSGKLDETVKKLILEQRGLITQPHEDGHRDEAGWSDPHCDKDLWTSHTDQHTDLGIGLDFPL